MLSRQPDLKAQPTTPHLHVTVHTGSQTARIVDMTNAGKRGAVCNVLRVSWNAFPGRADFALQNRLGDELGWMIGQPEFAALSFEDAAAIVESDIAEAREAGVPGWAMYSDRDTIRGIDAPRVKLEHADPEGRWTITADETGISISDLTDMNNLPRMITSRQSKAQAYAIARKVWPQVVKAESMWGAGDILGKAGARLHSYCAMD